MKVFYSDLIAIFRANGPKGSAASLQQCLEICRNASGMNFKQDELKDAKEKFRKLANNFWIRWNAAKRTENRFLAKYADWMQGELEISDTSDPVFKVDLRSGPGRPSKSHAESSQRSQRRHKRSAVEAFSGDASLALDVAATVAKKSKNVELARILKLVQDTPDQKKMRKLIENPPIKMTTTRALALFMDGDKTRASYQLDRMTGKELNAEIHPSYQRLLAEKKLCFPQGTF